MKHELHKCHDENCAICDGGLSWCRICGGGEAALPTDCPGVRMTDAQALLVQQGIRDYRNGEWVTLRSVLAKKTLDIFELHRQIRKEIPGDWLEIKVMSEGPTYNLSIHWRPVGCYDPQKHFALYYDVAQCEISLEEIARTFTRRLKAELAKQNIRLASR